MKRWMLLLALFGCDDGGDPVQEGADQATVDGASDAAPTPDSALERDAAPTADAGAQVDARLGPDGSEPAADAAAPTPDAGPDPDAAPDPDADPDADPDPDAGPGPDGSPGPDAGPDPDLGPDPDAGPEPDAGPDLDAARDPDMAPPEPDMALLEPDMAPPEPDAGEEVLFSFFVTSLQRMRELSESEDGFGGDLGGLEGADAICQRIGELEGFGYKTWRAFLSATDGGDGEPVHAIERIGEGPWFDRNGRLVAVNVRGLLNERPAGDPQIIEDLPDEFGVPLTILGDSHDVMTGSDRQGRLDSADPRSTCNDWTSSSGRIGGRLLKCGHSWPRSPRSGRHWISDHTLRGCAPGVNLIQNGPGVGDCVGCSGGYGGIYCFALQP